jgi:50S ribosomal protein L16 3-hydroxylase
LSVENFLERHWQKSPLFMPRAMPADLPQLGADELAWLATLDDVESRIIFSRHEGDTTNYRLEHGPFDDYVFASLPPRDWTLLVQDVEKHLPDFRRFIEAASFIPDWRIDDLMVSFAAPGGGVGPHRDNYDVFLCQGAGRREWRIAQTGARLKTVEYGELSLLQPFTEGNTVDAEPGDVLYLPPGVGHWGIAREACMTYSIGMRAPTQVEFTAGVARIQDTDIVNPAKDDIFYCDPDLAVDEARPGLISSKAIKRARRCFTNVTSLSDADIAAAFGSVVTDVKAWLAPEAPDADEAARMIASPSGPLCVHGMARLAYCTVSGEKLVFVNGHSKLVNTDQMDFFRRICTNRMVHVSDDDLFRWLLVHGAFDLQPVEESNAT